MAIGTSSSAPDADFASTPVASGTVPRRGDDRDDREGRRGAQNRADIMRIGDLVEHQHDAAVRQILDVGRGQGIGLGEQPLMHRVGRELRGRSHPGRTTSGASGGVMPSSASRRSAFSVSRSLRKWRAGLASAAVTVCQP